MFIDGVEEPLKCNALFSIVHPDGIWAPLSPKYSDIDVALAFLCATKVSALKLVVFDGKLSQENLVFNVLTSPSSSFF